MEKQCEDISGYGKDTQCTDRARRSNDKKGICCHGKCEEEIRILDEKVMENCRLIVEHYGVGHQLIQLAEECGELATASLHFRRGKIGKEQFATEVADVMVMVQQLIQCGFIEEDDIYRLTLYKTERQLERIRRGTE